MKTKERSRRLLSVLLALLLLLSLLPASALAGETSTVPVTVSISQDGAFVRSQDGEAMVNMPIALSGKETYTIDDALRAAHETYYSGGANAGYETRNDATYGLGLTKLWGDASGQFGYQINGGAVSVLGLSQTISAGDRIDAYLTQSAYPDTEVYTAFADPAVTAYVGAPCTLTLRQMVYDESYHPSMAPCEGAALTIGGTETETKTAADGSAGLTFDTAGSYLVSAVKMKTVSDQTVTAITAPACVVTVREAPALTSLAFSNSNTATEAERFRVEKTGALEYKLYRPDYAVSGYAYAKATTQNAGDKVWVQTKTPWGGNVTPGEITDTWSSINNGPNALTQFESFSVKVGPGTGADAPENMTYTVYGLIAPSLKELSLTGNETMSPAFNRAVTAYTAYIPYDAASIPITATGYDSGYTVAVNGASADSMTPSWDDNGRMTVSVQVTTKKNVETTYTLTLIREKAENTPFISLQPRDAAYLDTKAAVPLKVRASANGALSYQWYRNTVNSSENGTPIAGAATDAYTPVITDLGKTQSKREYYYCVVTNTVGETVYTAATNAAAITTTPDPTPTVALKTAEGGELPKDGYSYAKGDTAAAVQVTAASDAEGGTWSYQWKNGESDAPGTSDAAAYTPPTTKDGASSYACVVTYTVDGAAYRQQSDAVSVKVVAAAADTPTITTQPTGGEYLVNTSGLTPLRVSAGTSDGGKLTYQWQSSTDGTTYTDLADATNSYVTPAAASEASAVYYRCHIVNTVTSVSGVPYTAAIDSAPAVITFKTPEWEGKGTAQAPYLLKSAADLTLLQQYVSKGQTFSGTNFKMTADITLPEGWAAIGASNADYFAGTFDGGGCLLTVPEGGLPLFSYTKNATLTNLNIYGKKIAGYGVMNHYVGVTDIRNVTLKSGTQTLYSGFIGGYASGMAVITITNCTVEKGVVIGYDRSQSNIGSFGGEYNGTIKNCVSYATVYGKDFVGGIVANKGQTMGPFSIKNCFFGGTVAATGNYVGGIAGGGYGGTGFGLASAPNTPAATIQNCYATGDITGGDDVGGILGAEPGLVQCWLNGIGYIQNNHFAGKVTATGGTYVGGIIGYFNGIDKYDIITNNYFQENCGAARGIGFIQYVDTSSAVVDKTLTGVTYFNTSDGTGSYPTGAKPGYNRTDDPLGADADKLAKAVSADAMKDGSVAKLLNSGENSAQNWVQGEACPVFSEKPILIQLTLGGSYQTQYVIGDSFSTDHMTITAIYSDDSTKSLRADEVTFTGFDSAKRGVQTVQVTYEGVTTEYTVRLLLPESGAKTITVSFSLLGDTRHDSDKDGVKHTLAGGNLETWISTKSVTVSQNATVRVVLEKVLTQEGLTWSNPTGNYVESIIRSGVTLAEFTNGAGSGWMYTLNGRHPELGVDEQYLNSGDVIVFHYTDDYTREQGSEKWSSGGGSSSSDSPVSSVVEQAAAVSGSSASAFISDSAVANAVKAVKSVKNGTILLQPTGTGSASTVSASLSKSAVQSIAEGTDAALTVQTNAGTVTLPHDALTVLASQAAGSSIAITAAKKTAADVTDPTIDTKDAVIAAVTITSGGKQITSFGGKSLTVTLPVDSTYTEKAAYKVVVLSADGKTETLSGRCVKKDGKLFVEVSVSHLSTFVVTHEKTLPFLDVKDGAWYYDAVGYAYSKGLFAGTSDTAFSPETPMTRAMVVTVLWRMENKPVVNAVMPFTDVSGESWYTEAVRWAAAEKMITGIGETTFAPNAPVTREQLAAILYRYAAYKRYDTTQQGGMEIRAFADFAHLSDYALTAMTWAVNAKLVQGDSGKLLPKNDATRAQVAAILMRFCENAVS